MLAFTAMHLLPLPSTRPLAAAPRDGDSDAFRQALAAYRVGMAGLHTRSLRRFEGLIGDLDDGADPALKGQVLAMAGAVARVGGRWSLSHQWLGDAFPLLVQGQRFPIAAVCLCLDVEGLCAEGRLSEARQTLAAKSASSPSGLLVPALELANASLQLATGNLAEAMVLAGRIAERSQDLTERAWAALLRAEARLDQDRPLEAEQELLSVLHQLEDAGGLDEAYVRGTVLVARMRIEMLWLGAEPSAADCARAHQALKRARAASVGMGRYRAAAAAIEAQLMRVEDDVQADPHFAAAVVSLEAAGLRLDQGRALSREAASRYARVRRPAGLLIARGRDLLTRATADARSQHLARLESGTEGAGASMAVSRSLMASRMIALPGEDDLELHALFEVNKAISSTLDVTALMEKILAEVVGVLKAERAALIRRLPDGTLVCSAARGIDPTRVREGDDELSFTVLREVEKTQEVVLTDNAQTDQRFQGTASVLAGEIRSVMCAPLKTQKGLTGFLYLDSSLKARIFKAEHTEILAIFATQAAVALENALAFAEIDALNRDLEHKVEERTRALSAMNGELTASLDNLRNTQLRVLELQKEALDKEMSVARTIQESIVPSREAIDRPGVTLVGRVEPASQVGGDFWTFLELSEDRTLILIGDVTGHGVGAGMVTTLAKACADTLVHRDVDLDVTKLLSTLSDVLFQSNRGALAMTAFACVVDPRARTLTFSNAAHNMPFFIEAAGGMPKLSALVSRGNRVGAAKNTPFTARTRSYAAGDRLFLFTDGLVECTDAVKAPYGERRLRLKLVESARLEPSAQLDFLTADFAAHFGTHPRDDDVTAVLAALS